MVLNELGDFDMYYEEIQTGKFDHVNCKRLVCISIGRCDICEKNDCVNNQGTHLISMQCGVFGVQLCDNCEKAYDMDMIMYKLSLSECIIHSHHFNFIVNQIFPAWNFEKIYVKRTSGEIELWKLNYNQYIMIDNDEINIPVIASDERIHKTIKLDMFCELNNIDYVKLFETLNKIYLCRC